MSLILTFMELDKLYESDSLKESALSIADLKAFYETATSIDKNEYPNFFVWYDAQVRSGKIKKESLESDAESDFI